MRNKAVQLMELIVLAIVMATLIGVSGIGVIAAARWAMG